MMMLMKKFEELMMMLMKIFKELIIMLINQSVKYCNKKKDKLLFSTLFCFLFQEAICMKCQSFLEK